jgi:hypothetical protein
VLQRGQEDPTWRARCVCDEVQVEVGATCENLNNSFPAARRFHCAGKLAVIWCGDGRASQLTSNLCDEKILAQDIDLPTGKLVGLSAAGAKRDDACGLGDRYLSFQLEILIAAYHGWN